MNTVDRIPPHSPDAEAAVIGAAIKDPALIPELRAEWFFDRRLAANGQPIDPAIITEQMRQSGLADAFTLIDCCMTQCHSAANFPYWRNILRDILALRRVLQVCIETEQRIFDVAAQPGPHVAGVLDAFERDALAIRPQTTGDGHGEATGIRTGFYDLDKFTAGLKPQQLVVIAARSSVGKTSLALNIAEHVAVTAGLPVAFFSLEMSSKELVHRLACSLARVDSAALNAGKATEPDLRKLTLAHRRLATAPLHIFDRGGLSLGQLATLGRRMVQRYAVKLLIVDYLGLLRSGEKTRSRYEETTLVSNGLKTLAKELNLPVLALCQLNRNAEREDRPPRLSDLRDSGAIEQDADIVGLLHREETNGTVDRVTLHIAKHRNGPTGRVALIFQRRWTRFESVTNENGGRANMPKQFPTLNEL